MCFSHPNLWMHIKKDTASNMKLETTDTVDVSQTFPIQTLSSEMQPVEREKIRVDQSACQRLGSVGPGDASRELIRRPYQLSSI